MVLAYTTLDLMRDNNPAWRLLRSDHAPLVVSFLHRVFIAPNVRSVRQGDLVEALEDDLFALRKRLGDARFPKSPLEYLNDWATPSHAWLRKFYGQDSDEPYFDVTAEAEKAIVWLTTLTERTFIGTESRLLTLIELLRQIVEGSETDPQKRIAELQRHRDELDGEIARVLAGEITVLDDTGLRDRFQQFVQLARDLLSDFREVETNFRKLDRRVRERIASWDGSKGTLLEEIMGERDAITESDEGRSFRAFWDFLMSSHRQEEVTALLDRVLRLPAVSDLKPDSRIRRVHYDWLDAGENTQRTVADLSKQLRRFLDDQAWLENRRIMDILHGIETKALAIRESLPTGDFMTIFDMVADIELPMERPLYTPTAKPHIIDVHLGEEQSIVDATALFSQVVVDKTTLSANIRQALQTRSQVALAELCEMYPLKHGLAELVAYLQLSSDGFKSAVDENSMDTIAWHGMGIDGRDCVKQARLPRLIFVR